MYLRPHALARLLLILPETSDTARDLAGGDSNSYVGKDGSRKWAILLISRTE